MEGLTSMHPSGLALRGLGGPGEVSRQLCSGGGQGCVLVTAEAGAGRVCRAVRGTRQSLMSLSGAGPRARVTGGRAGVPGVPDRGLV